MHNFKKWPELTNNQMQFYYWDSPHRQITEGFVAKVVKVTDGDTVRVEWSERNFDFPIRLQGINSPEIDTSEGRAAQNWLESEIMGKEVYVGIDFRNRTGKFGRIIGDVISGGDSMSEASQRLGHSNVFGSEDGA